MLCLLPSEDAVIPPQWRKVATYLQLWRLGCPVLKSALLTERGDLLRLEEVIAHLGSGHCTLRFQYVRPCASPARGGNPVALSRESLEPQWSPDRLLWPMEPTNRLLDRFGVNIGYQPEEDRLVFEIVGRGFDVSDINRGDLTPHQIVRVNGPRTRYEDLWKCGRVRLVSEGEYRLSVERRAEKIKRMGLDVGRWRPEPRFDPVSLGLLETLYGYASRVVASYHYREALVVSCSVLEDWRIVFWDIQTPGGKYATLYEEPGPSANTEGSDRRRERGES